MQVPIPYRRVHLGISLHCPHFFLHASPLACHLSVLFNDSALGTPSANFINSVFRKMGPTDIVT